MPSMPRVKRIVDRSGPDYYPTPPWATWALLEEEPFEGSVLECACGDGSMARVLTAAGLSVQASDLHDRGYGAVGVDYLRIKGRVANVVTNPPFILAEEFVKKSLAVVDHKFAFLLRLAFLESASRAHSIFLRRPPSRVWVFTDRVTMYPAGVETGGTSTTAFAWFVWDMEDPGPCRLGWFRPGAEQRYLGGLSKKGKRLSL